MDHLDSTYVWTIMSILRVPTQGQAVVRACMGNAYVASDMLNSWLQHHPGGGDTPCFGPWCLLFIDFR